MYNQISALITVILAIVASNAQVLPIWSETPRIDTGDVLLIQNPSTTTMNITFTTSYHTGRVFSGNPTVALGTAI